MWEVEVFISETCVVHLRDVLYSYERYQSSIREICLVHVRGRGIHIRDMSHYSFTWETRASFIRKRYQSSVKMIFLIHVRSTKYSCERHVSFTWETRLIHKRETWVIRHRDIPYSLDKYEVFIRETCLLHMRDASRSYERDMSHPSERHFLFMWEVWSVHIRDMPPSHEKRASFLRETCRIHTRETWVIHTNNTSLSKHLYLSPCLYLSSSAYSCVDEGLITSSNCTTFIFSLHPSLSTSLSLQTPALRRQVVKHPI